LERVARHTTQFHAAGKAMFRSSSQSSSRSSQKYSNPQASAPSVQFTCPEKAEGSKRASKRRAKPAVASARCHCKRVGMRARRNMTIFSTLMFCRDRGVLKQAVHHALANQARINSSRERTASSDAGPVPAKAAGTHRNRKYWGEQLVAPRTEEESGESCARDTLGAGPAKQKRETFPALSRCSRQTSVNGPWSGRLAFTPP